MVETAQAEEVIVVPEVVQIEVTYTTEDIVRKIKEVFPEDPETAVKIAKCESHLIPDIQSYQMLNGSRERSYGLFQVFAPVWHDEAMQLGYTEYQTEVEDNLLMARYIYEVAGKSWQPWSCFSKKMI